MAKSTFPEFVRDMIQPAAQEYDRKVRAVLRRVFGFAFCAAFVVIGIGIMSLGMLPVLTCRYVEPGQVDCLLEERIAGFIPVHKTRVTGLQEAYVDQETVLSEDEDGNQTKTYYAQVILMSRSGEIRLQKVESMGSLAQLTSARINAYLSAYAAEPLTVWGVGLVEHLLCTLGGGIFVLVFGFASLALILGSALLIAGWLVDWALVVIGWGAGMLGRDPQVKDRMLRLRSAVKEIVTQPDN